ncbi:PAC2 family protein [Corynebacterium spheniscorum]|uniref:Predicted ATP-dependent carboligase, ATP-grasp superfamily n=1 Tax=Corynebacterium spheniscorum TaxID=185761 RepID=A0A1I2TXY1_9CORY|nr:PAC2 family protein [Corynebacterium spheniscorum]KAA8721790.1 PAC2 family protein [Corynebacterium spheniscorum]SFG69643.1 Predicted ATP-dependent carboligase, ATP-grasp superfamily [Corynebacterium spheniscorum]
MQDHHRNMYELEYPVPEVRSLAANGHEDSKPQGPTLVIAMQGYADAGQAIDLGSSHLLAALDNSPLAVFNHDELVDYRSRRPATQVEIGGVKHISPISLELHVVRDVDGAPFLLLAGPEPDLRWSAFTDAVGDLIERFNVQRTICLYSAPMTVPHTRPMVISAHGNDPALMKDLTTFDSHFTVPGSASLFIEKWLNDRKRSVAGYTAHVPHYVSASPYPEATLRLLEAVKEHTGLNLPLSVLEVDCQSVAQQMQEQMEDSREIQHVVHALEQQYDEEAERHRRQQALAAEDRNVPDAEEIGKAFEEFLAGVDSEDPTMSFEKSDVESTSADDAEAESSAHSPRDAEDPGASDDHNGSNQDS